MDQVPVRLKPGDDKTTLVDRVYYNVVFKDKGSCLASLSWGYKKWQELTMFSLTLVYRRVLRRGDRSIRLNTDYGQFKLVLVADVAKFGKVVQKRRRIGTAAMNALKMYVGCVYRRANQEIDLHGAVIRIPCASYGNAQKFYLSPCAGFSVEVPINGKRGTQKCLKFWLSGGELFERRRK